MTIYNKNILGSTLLLSLLLMITACSTEEQPNMSEKDVATEWANMTLYITQYTPSNSPTFASRAFGYTGLTMYESIVPGNKEYSTMNNQVTGLTMLPTIDTDKEYNWILS
ncbi:MAG TPA: phosphoesterase, partial [Maribacter sp.]|nr:phosphoesterase [Maribacter sp.]